MKITAISQFFYLNFKKFDRIMEMNQFQFAIMTLTITEWLGFGLATLPLIFFGVFIFFFVKRKVYSLPFILIGALILLSYYLFQLSILTIILITTYVILINIFVVLNATELKAKIDRIFQYGKNDDPLRVVNYDKEMIYEMIYDAISFMSKNKIGALITLERTTKLDDYTKNGVTLNSPITSEMLTTIFYPGTRLHDGAVIIRGSFILAANVYYQPTTKPVLGKLGSRHRAAIGISEVTDAVTIVVSEESGRLSLTYGGQLEPVYLDTFKKTLANYMENRPHFEN
jgi:diadenylate cyclase